VLETREESIIMTVRSWLLMFLLTGTGLLVAATNPSPWLGHDCGRLDVAWSVDRGDYSYRLRGRYSIASLGGDFVTSIASDADGDGMGADRCVPPGLYRVTLEPGYTLERVEAETTDDVRPALIGESVEVPAWLVSPNPVVLTAKQGRRASMGLSLVDLPAAAPDPEATCMSGS
jgi:hypothetical protein